MRLFTSLNKNYRINLKSCRTFSSTSKGRPTGIFMMNLGGPSSQEEVEPFLTRLLSDSEIIKLPIQKWSGPLIAKRRSVMVKKQYGLIGGGSPIRKWTEKQGEAMCRLLDNLNPDTAPHKYYIGFRYADPMTEESLKKMKEDGVHRAVAFTQYPQYSCSTTGSSLNELYRQLCSNNLLNTFEWGVIDRWYSHPLLIKAIVGQIRKCIEQEFSDEEKKHLVLLFSAHSLPLSAVDRGDTYPHEVAATVHQVMKELNFEYHYRLVWQSKVGPAKWLLPATGLAMEGFAQNGWKCQMLVPISFTSDHIETLYEYDILYAELAQKKGIKMKRAESLNDHPIFIEALADIVSNHLKISSRSSKQLGLRCPHCSNLYCADMKKFFATG